MKLIHCADLHLDSPMESNLPPDKAKERRNEILSTFSDLVELADENGAAALLIAGDLFDSTRTTRRTERYVLDLIRSHPDLYFFYLAGNHDTGSALSDLEDKPENLCTFGKNWTTYDFGEVCIAGSEHPDPELLELSKDKINIVLLHGQKKESGNADGDTIPFRKYRDRGIDYLALGHLHSYQEAALDDRGIACYSGCLEGRGFDECGVKGYVLLEIENGRLSHEFIPMSRRSLHEVECDVSDCISQMDVEDLVFRMTDPIPKKDLVKVVLVGALSPDTTIDLPRLGQLLSERYYFAKVAVKTRIRINPEDYYGDVSLKGEFVRRVMESSLTDTEKERVITCGFRALCGEELDV